LKLELLQAELSLSVRVTVKLSVVPDATHALCAGVMLSVGLAGAHVEPANVTCTVAPVLLTAVGVMVIPAVESV
jgi:hypothetical protein